MRHLQLRRAPGSSLGSEWPSADLPGPVAAGLGAAAPLRGTARGSGTLAVSRRRSAACRFRGGTARRLAVRWRGARDDGLAPLAQTAARSALPMAGAQAPRAGRAHRTMRAAGCRLSEKTSAMKVLLHGGTGVFGSRLARLLVRDGHQVTIAGRNLGSARALAATCKGCAAMTFWSMPPAHSMPTGPIPTGWPAPR